MSRDFEHIKHIGASTVSATLLVAGGSLGFDDIVAVYGVAFLHGARFCRLHPEAAAELTGPFYEAIRQDAIGAGVIPGDDPLEIEERHLDEMLRQVAEGCEEA